MPHNIPERGEKLHARFEHYRVVERMFISGMLLIASVARMAAQQPLSLADADLRGATDF